MLSHVKIGFKLLFLLQEVLKDLMYHQTAVSYGPHQAEDGTISIIDLAAKKLTTKIDAKVLGANRLKFTPDGKLVFISSLQTGELTIYDARSHKEVKRLKIGHGAAGILMDPDGSRAFVACSADNYVAIIDLKTLEVTSHIDVGGVPDGLAWAEHH